MNALTTYKTRDWFESSFGRNSPQEHRKGPNNEPAVTSYLNYVSDKFTKIFDVNCYMCTTLSGDSHDISKGRGGDVNKVLQSISQTTLIIGN